MPEIRAYPLRSSETATDPIPLAGCDLSEWCLRITGRRNFTLLRVRLQYRNPMGLQSFPVCAVVQDHKHSGPMAYNQRVQFLWHMIFAEGIETPVRNSWIDLGSAQVRPFCPSDRTVWLHPSGVLLAARDALARDAIANELWEMFPQLCACHIDIPTWLSFPLQLPLSEACATVWDSRYFVPCSIPLFPITSCVTQPLRARRRGSVQIAFDAVNHHLSILIGNTERKAAILGMISMYLLG